MNGVAGSLFHALLCLLAVAALRLAVVQLGPRTGAILMGTPMLMLPLLAVQAWQGPPITQTQTAGSIASMVAVNAALWLYRLPVAFGVASGLLAIASGWLVAVTLLYLARLPDWVMACLLVVNGLFVLVRHRDHRAAVVATKGRLLDGAAITAAFLILFFLVTRLVPDFVRGVLVSFPLGVFATTYFVRRILPLAAFRDFIVYTQGAILAGGIFVLFVHFSLAHLPIVVVLGASLAVSFATTLVVGRIWRAPAVVQPPTRFAP
jgi:hypothetical protein